MDRIRTAFERQSYLLDLEARDLASAFQQAIVAMIGAGLVPPEQAAAVEAELHRRESISSTAIGHAVAIPHAYLDGIDEPIVFFVRLRQGINMGAPDLRPTRYLFILTGPTGRASEHLDTLTEIARCMSDKEFRFELRQAMQQFELLAAADAFTERATPARKRAQAALGGVPTAGSLGSGLASDVQRRLACYRSDFRDGMQWQTLRASACLFIACLTPALVFGGILQAVTGGQLGLSEMLLATALGGLIFALLGGQPLFLLGGTGAQLVFTLTLYQTCQHAALPFLPMYACVGCWSALFLLVFAVTNASHWLRYCTRFTFEIFSALIALPLIRLAVGQIMHELQAAQAHESVRGTALLGLLLTLGAYAAATGLGRVRRTKYLIRSIRELLANLGPTLALVAMISVAAFFSDITLESIGTSSDVRVMNSAERTHMGLVSILSLPKSIWLIAAIPGFLAALMTLLEQNVVARLVNSRDNQLQKGHADHLDLAIVGLLRFACSVFGLPWLVAGTVRSLNHLRFMATVEEKGTASGESQEEILHVCETRVTGIAISLLMGCSLLFLPWLQLIPVAILFGMLLYMGVVSLGGLQLFERVWLWSTDRTLYPKDHFARAVPRAAATAWTAVQLGCLLGAVLLSLSSYGLVFPLLIALLMPLRRLLCGWFQPQELALLDAEPEPAERETQWV